MVGSVQEYQLHASQQVTQHTAADFTNGEVELGSSLGEGSAALWVFIVDGRVFAKRVSHVHFPEKLTTYHSQLSG
jgi:hypothetical protein